MWEPKYNQRSLAVHNVEFKKERERYNFMALWICCLESVRTLQITSASEQDVRTIYWVRGTFASSQKITDGVVDGQWFVNRTL